MKLKFSLSLTIALGLAQLCSMADAQTNDTLKKIKETGTISLGGRDSSIPFSYTLGAPEPIGYSADLCRKIVEAVKIKLGMPDLKVRYTIVTPTNRIPLVQNGTVDLECSTTTNTVARQQQVDFSPSIFMAGVTAAVKKSSGINTFAEFGEKSVATVSGSTSIQLLRAYRKAEKTDIAEIHGKDTSEAFLLLASDRAVALVLEDVQLAGLIASSPVPGDYKILRERLRDEPYGFMFRKDDPRFKEVVDQTITGLMKSGEINEIYAKWFTRPVPPNNVNLNFPMSDSVREIYKNPNNKGV